MEKAHRRSHLRIDGEWLETTPEHPFYTQEQGWVAAGDLKPGDHIRKANGSYGQVQTVEIVQQAKTMYNLTVGTAHTFFVGEQEWLVHNKCNPVPLDVIRDTRAGRNNRVVEVSADLDIKYKGSNVQAKSQARKMVIKYGNEGDDAGHLIAEKLGGSAAWTSGNIIPQNRILNQGLDGFTAWTDLETELADALKAGKQVSVRIRLIYPNTTTLRPSKIIHRSEVDGVVKYHRFDNP